MTKTEAIQHFGSVNHLAEAMGIGQPAVSSWPGDNIPRLRQFQLEVITEGKLKADRSPIPAVKHPNKPHRGPPVDPAPAQATPVPPKLDIAKLRAKAAAGMSLTDLMKLIP